VLNLICDAPPSSVYFSVVISQMELSPFDGSKCDC